VTAELWTTIGVAVLGVVGTLAAALLTQRQANRLEVKRWEYERDREVATHTRLQRDEYQKWLRDKRHEIYSDLIRESSRFAANLIPLVNMIDRIEDPDSDLYKIRSLYFELQYRASFLAGGELQAVIRRAGDVTENCGHAPYDEDNPAEKAGFESEMVRQAFAVSRSLEDAARAELELPSRRRGEPTDDLHVTVALLGCPVSSSRPPRHGRPVRAGAAGSALAAPGSRRSVAWIRRPRAGWTGLPGGNWG
jgi:hypothetical protein